MNNRCITGITIFLLWLVPLVTNAADYRTFFATSPHQKGIKFIFLGNSGVILNSSQGAVVIDPSTLLEDYDIAQLGQATRVILLYTHGHGDHFDSRTAIKIFKATKAKIICDRLVYQTLSGKIPPDNLINGMDGKSYGFGEISVKVIFGKHSSPINLYRISLGNTRVFHGGDSGYVPLGSYPADVAFVPTGMPSPSASPEDALKMVLDLRSKVAVTMHGAEHQHHAFEDSLNAKRPDTQVIIPLKQVTKTITIE